MQIQTEVNIGDLVYIVSSKQKNPLPNQTKGVIFSQIDDDWFRVYISWMNTTEYRTFQGGCLKK